MAHPGTALPFLLRRQTEVVNAAEVTSTTEAVHGVLRLERQSLVIQWSTARETQRVGLGAAVPRSSTPAVSLTIAIGGGPKVSTERALDPVREVQVPLAGLAGAELRWQWRRWPPGRTLILRAADLRAFESLAGDAGLVLEHPAELSLRIRRRDRSLAREFAAELELQLADLALAAADDTGRVQSGNRGRPPGLRG